jgi:hypothetical protein
VRCQRRQANAPQVKVAAIASFITHGRGSRLPPS